MAEVENEAVNGDIVEVETTSDSDKTKYVKEEISIAELEQRLSQKGKEIGVDVVATIFDVSKEYLSPSKLSKLHTNKQAVLSKLEVVKKQPKTYSNPYSNLS